MDIPPLIKGAARLPIEAIRFPVTITMNTAERVGDYCLGIVTDSLELVAPTKTMEEFVQEHRKFDLLDEAEKAGRAIEIGEKNDDPELRFFASAALFKALGRAYKRKDVPPRVTKQVVEIVQEHGLDPVLEPLIADEDVTTAQKAIEKYAENKVTHIFPGHENKL